MNVCRQKYILDFFQKKQVLPTSNRIFASTVEHYFTEQERDRYSYASQFKLSFPIQARWNMIKYTMIFSFQIICEKYFKLYFFYKFVKLYQVRINEYFEYRAFRRTFLFEVCDFEFISIVVFEGQCHSISKHLSRHPLHNMYVVILSDITKKKNFFKVKLNQFSLIIPFNKVYVRKISQDENI